MQEITYLTYSGWFLLGLLTGIGPCVGHHFLIVLPYIGFRKESIRGGLSVVLFFSLARIITYSLLGFLAGAAGEVFYGRIISPFWIGLSRSLLAVLLILLALVYLVFDKSTICRRFQALTDRIPGRSIVLIGFFTALLPCPVLLGLLAYSAASGRMIYGAVSGFVFATGTSLSPLLAAGPLFAFLKGKIQERGKSFITGLAGLLLFAYGVHLLLQVF